MQITISSSIYHHLADSPNAEESLISFFTANNESPLIVLGDTEEGLSEGDYYFCRHSGNEYSISVNQDFLDSEHVFTAEKDFSRLYYSADYLKKKNVTFLDSLFCALRYRMLHVGGIAAHGAAVVYQEKAVLFCGFSGAGKSTQANLWKNWAKAEVLNYDKPFIFKKEDGYYVSGTPWSGKEPCYINRAYPLAAIVFIDQASEDRVIPYSPGEAYTVMYYNHRIDPLDDISEALYENNIANIIDSVCPILKLRCTKSKNAVKALYDYLSAAGIISAAETRMDKNMYIRKDGFILRNIADEQVLIPRGEHSIDFSATILFNDTAAFAWNCLENAMTVDELAAALVKEYSIDSDVAKKDASAFIEQMLEAGIVNSFD